MVGGQQKLYAENMSAFQVRRETYLGKTLNIMFDLVAPRFGF